MSSRSPLVQRQLFNDWCCINSRKEVVKKINKTFMVVELYAMILVRPNPILAQNLFREISGSTLNTTANRFMDHLMKHSAASNSAN